MLHVYFCSISVDVSLDVEFQLSQDGRIWYNVSLSGASVSDVDRTTYELVKYSLGALYTPETVIDLLDQKTFLDPSLVSCDKEYRGDNADRYAMDVIVYDAYSCPLAKETNYIHCECGNYILIKVIRCHLNY